MAPFEARRSSRLISMKKGTNNRQETERYNAILVSMETPNNYLKNLSKKDIFENLSGEQLTSCLSKAVTSCSKMNSDKKATYPSEARRSSRLKIMKNGINNGLETKTNKTILDSVGPDLVRSSRNKIECESGGKNVCDSTSVGPDESTHKSSLVVNSEYSDYVTTGGSLSKRKTKRRLEFFTDVNSPPISRNRRKNIALLSAEESSCNILRSGRLSVQPLDFWRNQHDKVSSPPISRNRRKNIALPAPEESSRKRLSSGRRIVTPLDYWHNEQVIYDRISSPPISRNRRRKIALLATKESSCKRSRSGRRIVPPLDYWRNEQVIYDKDRHITGVLNGLPVAESLTGGGVVPVVGKQKAGEAEVYNRRAN